MGERIPFPTLLKIEKGRQEPGVRRFYALMKLYDLPLELVPDLLELDDLAAEPPDITDPERLLAVGTEHWRRGRYGPALAHLFALRMLVPADEAGKIHRQKALLSFGLVAAEMGKARVAHRIAEQLLIEKPDPSLRIDVIAFAARAWLSLGSPDAALALLRYARSDMAPDRPHERALLLHQTACTLLDLQELDDAQEMIDEALDGYRDAGDDWNYVLALHVKFEIALRRGAHGDALEIARSGLAIAEQRQYAAPAARRRIDEGRALLAGGDVLAAISSLRQALAEGTSLHDGPIRFRAHYWLWKAYLQLGDAGRARTECAAARHFVRFVDGLSEETREVRGLVRDAPPEGSRPAETDALEHGRPLDRV